MKHTSILIPFALAGLTLMSFACAEEEEGTYRSNDFPVEEQDFVAPFQLAQEIEPLYSFTKKPIAVLGDADCLSDKRSITNEKFFAKSEHIVEVVYTGCGDYTYCNNSSFGIDSTEIKANVVKNFSDKAIPKLITIISNEGCHVEDLGRKRLISLLPYKEAYFMLNSLDLAESIDEAKHKSASCTQSKIASNTHDLHIAYIDHLSKKEKATDKSKEIYLGLYDEICIADANEREARSRDNIQNDTTEEEGSEVIDESNE